MRRSPPPTLAGEARLRSTVVRPTRATTLAKRRRCRPTDASKLIVRNGFGYDTDAVSGFAKTAPDFSTEVVNGYGKLAKITAHRCAPMHLPLDPVAAISIRLFDCAKTTEDVLSFVLSEGASASSWSRPIRGHRRAGKSE